MTDSESQYPISYLCSITTFVYLLPFKSYSTRQFWLGFPYTGENFGIMGSGDPQNLNVGDSNPQKALP